MVDTVILLGDTNAGIPWTDVPAANRLDPRQRMVEVYWYIHGDNTLQGWMVHTWLTQPEWREGYSGFLPYDEITRNNYHYWPC